MPGYPIKLTPDDNGTYLVTCPALPEVTTFGETDDEIERVAIAAIEEAIAARISYAEPLPVPVPSGKPGRNSRFVKLPAMTVLKVQLSLALRDSGLSRAELARRLGWHREQVDRLFRLDHASRLDQLEAAFKALQRELDVRIVDAAECGRQAVQRKDAAGVGGARQYSRILRTAGDALDRPNDVPHQTASRRSKQSKQRAS
jgi:antitoxin HicB